MTIKQGSNWLGSYSRLSYEDTGAEQNRYFALLKEKQKSVLDDDFNFAQDATLTAIRRGFGDFFGNISPNDGFKIVGTGAVNDFTITGGGGTVDTAGVLYVLGLRLILPSNTTYLAQEIPGPALAPPGSGTRADTVYVDVWLDEVGPSEDSSMVDPTLNVETSRRLKLKYMVRVAAGAAAPANYIDANGIRHYIATLAEILRTTSTQITAGMVTDKRATFTKVWTDGNLAPVSKSGDTMVGALGIAVGSDAAPGLFVAGDPNTGIRGGADDTLRIITAGVERLRATSAGTVQPGADNAQALGTAALRWSDVRTARLNGATIGTPTAANTASTLVLRDANERFQAADPSAAQDVATKNYVDTKPGTVIGFAKSVAVALGSLTVSYAPQHSNSVLVIDVSVPRATLSVSDGAKTISLLEGGSPVVTASHEFQEDGSTDEAAFFIRYVKETAGSAQLTYTVSSSGVTGTNGQQCSIILTEIKQ